MVAAVQLDETDPEDDIQSGNLASPVSKSRSFQPGLLTVDPSLMRGISLSETLQYLVPFRQHVRCWCFGSTEGEILLRILSMHSCLNMDLNPGGKEKPITLLPQL